MISGHGQPLTTNGVSCMRGSLRSNSDSYPSFGPSALSGPSRPGSQGTGPSGPGQHPGHIGLRCCPCADKCCSCMCWGCLHAWHWSRPMPNKAALVQTSSASACVEVAGRRGTSASGAILECVTTAPAHVWVLQASPPSYA